MTFQTRPQSIKAFRIESVHETQPCVWAMYGPTGQRGVMRRTSPPSRGDWFVEGAPGHLHSGDYTQEEFDRLFEPA